MPTASSIALAALTVATLTLSACSEKPPTAPIGAPPQPESKPSADAPVLRTVVVRDGAGLFVTVDVEPSTPEGAIVRTLRLSTPAAAADASPAPMAPWSIALRLPTPVDWIDAEGTLSDGRSFRVRCDTTLDVPLRRP